VHHGIISCQESIDIPSGDFPRQSPYFATIQNYQMPNRMLSIVPEVPSHIYDIQDPKILCHLVDHGVVGLHVGLVTEHILKGIPDLKLLHHSPKSAYLGQPRTDICRR
jgi:hypothetical protein